MRTLTRYLTFETPERRQFVRITDEVQQAVDESGVAEGMVLVSAMHITAGVWVNDDEPGILEDTLEWLDKLAPPHEQHARALLHQPPRREQADAAARARDDAHLVPQPEVHALEAMPWTLLGAGRSGYAGPGPSPRARR